MSTTSSRSICRASSIIWPIPLSALSSSTATSASHARASAIRTPVSSGGNAAGSSVAQQREARP